MDGSCLRYKTMPVYDSNVFDIPFDTMFGIPAVLKVDVPREHRKILSGHVVIVTVFVINVIDPAHKYLFNPSSPPIISIFHPDGTNLIFAAPMFNISTGMYQYRHQTGVRFDSQVLDVAVFDSGFPDPLGVYTAHFYVSDGPYAALTTPVEIYEVIR